MYSYSDKCCKNLSTNECALMGHPPQGHSDVTLDHCPTSSDGASGLFSVLVDENKTTGRHGDCCKEIASSVEWTYTDGSGTGADVDGNTGCQKDGTCAYAETCCYNTFKDHKCYLWKGLPLINNMYGNNVACPEARVDGRYMYKSDDSDGRNNHCCAGVS